VISEGDTRIGVGPTDSVERLVFPIARCSFRIIKTKALERTMSDGQ